MRPRRPKSAATQRQRRRMPAFEWLATRAWFRAERELPAQTKALSLEALSLEALSLEALSLEALPQ